MSQTLAGTASPEPPPSDPERRDPANIENVSLLPFAFSLSDDHFSSTSEPVWASLHPEPPHRLRPIRRPRLQDRRGK